MASLINTLLILKPDKFHYVLVHLKQSKHDIVKAIGFPIYSKDLVLGEDRYPEYELIKHLPNKHIIEYFLNQLNQGN